MLSPTELGHSHFIDESCSCYCRLLYVPRLNSRWLFPKRLRPWFFLLVHSRATYPELPQTKQWSRSSPLPRSSQSWQPQLGVLWLVTTSMASAGGSAQVWFCRLTALRSLISDFICRILETIFCLPSELGFLALCSPHSLGTSQAFSLALFWCSFANFVVRSSCCEASALTCFISSSSVIPGVRRVILNLDAKISSQRPDSKDFTNFFWISERP